MCEHPIVAIQNTSVKKRRCHYRAAVFALLSSCSRKTAFRASGRTTAHRTVAAVACNQGTRGRTGRTVIHSYQPHHGLLPQQLLGKSLIARDSGDCSMCRSEEHTSELQSLM